MSQQFDNDLFFGFSSFDDLSSPDQPLQRATNQSSHELFPSSPMNMAMPGSPPAELHPSYEVPQIPLPHPSTHPDTHDRKRPSSNEATSSSQGTTHHSPHELWSQLTGGDRTTLTCPDFWAAIIEGRNPTCKNSTARNFSEVLTHLINHHGRFVEACPVCRQVVLSPQERAAHGNDFTRCLNTPFRKKGPEAVQVQWTALFQTLYPSITTVPSPSYSDLDNGQPAGQASNTPTRRHMSYNADSHTSRTHQDFLPPAQVIGTPAQPNFAQHPSNQTNLASSRSPQLPLSTSLSSPAQNQESSALDGRLREQVMRELLIEERGRRYPSYNRNALATLVDNDISQAVQSRQPHPSPVQRARDTRSSQTTPRPSDFGPFSGASPAARQWANNN
ncbi:hypothetical protein CC80DRAFT_509603 [Byssothecium circinans]|uniref:Uncharacterized protein n=1 Tax=Byssothecium circinans TaxID=147558 RepID=A0A6A5TDU6_9PLEO|nr:hypothetical protein CC80DRAFT_509603 [Byssothecium circinans]